MNNRESNIARGWSYSQQSNLYLKKAALYSLENPRILWSCQPLISKGSLADRDLDLSYGARQLWFWHQICRYYTVCHHVEAYTLGRLSIDGFSFERVAQFNLEWIFSKLDSGFQSLVGFRILKPRIPDSRSKKFRDSGVRIPLHGAKSWLSTIYIGKPAGSRFGKMVRTFQDWQIASWNRVYHFYNYKSVPIIEKRPRKPEMQYQRYGFEEMEHEFSSV